MRKNTWKTFGEALLTLLACLSPWIIFFLFRQFSSPSKRLMDVGQTLFILTQTIGLYGFMYAVSQWKQILKEIKNTVKIDYYLRKGNARQVLALFHLEVRDQWKVKKLVIKRLFNMKSLNELWELYELSEWNELIEWDNQDLLSNCIMELVSDKDKLIKLFNLIGQKKPYRVAITKWQKKILFKLVDLKHDKEAISLLVEIGLFSIVTDP